MRGEGSTASLSVIETHRFDAPCLRLDEYYAQHSLPSQISTFLTLFRTTLPELHAYFDEEELDMIGLASAWLRHLLAAEMRSEDLMRLWGE